MNEIREKKYSVKISGKRITDYIYDDVNQATNTLYGVIYETKNIDTIHAFDKQTGRILFKKEGIKYYDRYNNYLVMELLDSKFYVYFDNIQMIRGPFDDVEIKNNFIIVKRSKLHGLYNTMGDRLLPIKYDYICVVSDDLLEVGYKDIKSGLVNHKGEYVLEPIYDRIDYYFDDTLIKFYNEQKDTYGVINQYGEYILPCDYEKIEVDEKRGLLYPLKRGLYGIYKHNGGFIFAPTFKSIARTSAVIELTGIDGRVYGYIPKLDKLLNRNCYVYEQNYLKYFDGCKWRRLKYGGTK